MSISQTIKACAAFAAACLMLSSASPARAGLPEVSLDIFAPGMGAGGISVLELQAREGGEELHGPVAWSGHELAASVRMEDGRVAAAMLRGTQDGALIGMFMAEMAERNMLPALMESDGSRSDLMREAFDMGMDKDQCRRSAAGAMERWASQGKEAFGILFLPERVFLQAAAGMRGRPEAPLEEILRDSLGFDPNLVPQDEKMAFVLFLDRRDGSLAFHIGSVERPGNLLENWNGQRAEKP